jgi:Hemerythrin HHE cation binding domain
MQEVGTGIDRIIDEHKELRRMTGALRTFLDAPRPLIGAQGAHTWASDLAEQLVKLHDKVFRHFRDEESSGVFEEICREKPQAGRAIEVLCKDHDRMLADLRALLGAAMVYSEAKTPEDQRLRRWTLSILSQLEQHEQDETELIQKAFCIDLGAGD